MNAKVSALVRAWLTIDFFTGGRGTSAGSALSTTIFTQSFLGLLLAAFLFPETPPTAYAAANLTLSMLMVGLGALGDARYLLQERADDVLLRVAPVTRLQVALARTLHGAFHVVLITVGMALPPAILTWWIGGHELWRVFAYLALACLLSGIVAGTVAVTVRAATLAFGTQRGQLVAATSKGLVLGGGLAAFLLCRTHLRGTVDELPFLPWAARAWPGYWAAKVLHDPAPLRWLLLLLALAAAVFALGTLLARAGGRAARARVPRGGRPSLLLRLLAGRGPLLGVATFTAAMLARSASFRSRLLPLVAVPVVLMLLALRGADPTSTRLLVGMALQFPAMFLPFLVAFLPLAEQPHVGWVFASSPHATVTLGRRAALLALSTQALLPVHVLLLVLAMVAGLPVADALTLSVSSLGGAVLFAALAVQRLPCVPFTADTEDHEAVLEFGGLVGIWLALALLGAGLAQIAGRPAGLAGAVLAMVAAGMVLRRARNHG